jgi:hypothetical protein
VGKYLSRVDQHPDGDKEHCREDVADGLHKLLDLFFNARFCHEAAGDKSPEGHGIVKHQRQQSEPERETDTDDDDRFRPIEPDHEPDDAGDSHQPDNDKCREERRQPAGSDRQFPHREVLAAGYGRENRDQEYGDQVFNDEDAEHDVGEVAADAFVLKGFHDDRGAGDGNGGAGVHTR